MSDELLAQPPETPKVSTNGSITTKPISPVLPLNVSDGQRGKSSSGLPNQDKNSLNIDFESAQYQTLNWFQRWDQFQKGTAMFFTSPKKYFNLEGRNTSFWIELKGGFATFLTMAYILVVNPAILSQGNNSALGLTYNRVLTATAFSAAICNILMGLFTNFPMAVAAGMGLNAFISYEVIPRTNDYKSAMGLVVLDGILVLFLVLIGVREKVLTSIPDDLRRAISVSIGLFIALIGAYSSKLVLVPQGTRTGLILDPDAILPPVGPGSFQKSEVLVVIIGFLIMAILSVRKIPGAVIIGIIISTLLALILDLIQFEDFEAPDFSIAFKADVTAPFRKGNGFMWGQLFTFAMVDFFDTLGTMTACSTKAGLTNPKNGVIPNSTPILIIDSLSAIIGGLFGASSNTAYIECATGICEGARTGLHSIFVGIFFLLAVGLAPLASIVPQCATAPALLLIGFMMCDQITEIKFDINHYETGIPSFLIILLVPMTHSIAHGIGYGFIAYVVIMLGGGKWKEIGPVMYVSASIFVVFFFYADVHDECHMKCEFEFLPGIQNVSC